MSDQSNKWDSRWSELLTRCHGKDVEADAGFKAELLAGLKRRTAENRQAETAAGQGEDANWGRMMKAAYIPCHPEEGFKTNLLARLKARQGTLAGLPETAEKPAVEDAAFHTILTKSYQPVAPRKEFETRLLENLKERQRTATQTRIHTRRRTLYLSVASSMAAAAMVMFVVWLAPHGGNATPGAAPARGGDLHLVVPDTAVNLAPQTTPISSSGVMFASFNDDASDSPEPTARPAATFAHFETTPAVFNSYKVADAFKGPALPDRALAAQNVEMNSGKGWQRIADAERIAIRPGDEFRSSTGMAHLEFADGSLVSLSPETILKATAAGLTVARGFMLVAVPSTSSGRFRLHFPERDIAIEPGTDLAVMVENPDKFAAGGAPAPMVMILDSDSDIDGAHGGMALARNKFGVGPLFAQQLYRLDNYVTPDLPSRTLCDTERKDLDQLVKMETVRQPRLPMASFAGGFGAADREFSNYSMIVTPAGFTKKGARWVADNYNGEETTKIKYLSDAYFGFANERRDLARALALGGEVVMDGGDGTFYEVVK